jgi:multicomponent K+:H+ antiporter subunit D
MTGAITAPDHLIIAPVLIPFLAGAIMLLYDESQRRAKLVVSLIAATALLGVSVLLIVRAGGNPTSAVGVYLLGDWPVPIAIVLVLDRLSALMLALVALLAIPAIVYSAAGWHKQGQHFHSLFQFLLMGLNGTFLTGDIFNLFVFFEVMLAASYGLLLHGSGRVRVMAGLHYIAINLTASLLFLIAAALIYGLTGTLNMADLVARAAELSDGERPLFHVAMAFLALVFLVKAAIWPLCFWLPAAYSAGAAPVVAMFAIATKVGVYAILRLSMLLVGPEGGASAGFGSEVLLVAGMASVAFGTLGVLASREIARIAAHVLLISSGTILAAIGFVLAGGALSVLSGGLFYLVSSTLGASALFLLAEPMSRATGGSAAVLALTEEAYGAEDDDTEPEFGYAITGGMAAMGLAFGSCVIVLAGLPPLSGFLGKFAMLDGAFALDADVPAGAWLLLAVLLVSGLATLIALVRLGVQTIWATEEEELPRVLAIEMAPVVVLIGLTVLLTVRAGSVMGYLDETARMLVRPNTYVEGVFSTPRAAQQKEAE